MDLKVGFCDEALLSVAEEDICITESGGLDLRKSTALLSLYCVSSMFRVETLHFKLTLTFRPQPIDHSSTCSHSSEMVARISDTRNIRNAKSMTPDANGVG